MMRAIALAAIAWATVPCAQAAFTFTIDQVGNDVVVTGAGTLDLSLLAPFRTIKLNSSDINPNSAEIAIDPVATMTVYQGINGPTSFTNTTGEYLASSTAGYAIALFGFSQEIAVDSSYVSGTSVANTATFTGATLAEMGLTPGTTYSYTFGFGGSAEPNELTVVVVPEPRSSLLLITGSALLLFVCIRRR